MSPENAILGVKDPHATMILGYSQPPVEDRSQPPVDKLEGPIGEYSISLQQSIQAVGYKARNYRMQGCAGAVKDVHSQADVFNDLEKLDSTFRPTKVSAWVVDGILKGVDVRYSSGDNFKNGDCIGPATHWLELLGDGSEIIVEVIVTENVYKAGSPVIASLQIATSACNTLDTSIDMELQGDGKKDVETPSENAVVGTAATTEPPKAGDAAVPSTEATTSAADSTASDAPKAPAPTTPALAAPAPTPAKVETPIEIKTHTWVRPEDGQWSFRGFFGFIHEKRLISLGIVWGKDNFVPIPAARISTPLCKNFLGLCPALKESIKRIKLLKNARLISDNNFMGTSVVTTKATKTVAEDATEASVVGANSTQETDLQHFNALDKIDINWKIKAFTFASKNDKLTGIKILYYNGQEVIQGPYADADEKWRCEVGSDIVIAKITAGAMEDSSPAYLDTLEFVRADSEGQLPTWPLDFSTLRYLGESPKRVSYQISEVIEQAPKIGNSNWSARGFYGEHNGEYITRMGVVWGRG
jgi:hypothetical protein